MMPLERQALQAELTSSLSDSGPASGTFFSAVKKEDLRQWHQLVIVIMIDYPFTREYVSVVGSVD